MIISIQETHLALPPGYSTDGASEILAIGDIHGMGDHLEEILDHVDGKVPMNGERTVVFLGDLIDRGPQSLRCLDLALSTHNRPYVGRVIGLAGNHENMLRLSLATDKSALATSTAFEIWCANGGVSMLREMQEFTGSALRPGEIRTFLAGPRMEWLVGLQSHFASNNVLFVHAGVHPDMPLKQFLQLPWDASLHNLDEDCHWAWIREPFLDAVPGNGHHGCFVIHGHSPIGLSDQTTTQQQIDRFRLNLDGGTFAIGMTRAALISESEITLIDCWEA